MKYRHLLSAPFSDPRNSASGKRTFQPQRDIPSLSGRVVLITGGAGGLGRQAAVKLARHGRPARIYLADLPLSQSSKDALIDEITREAYDGVSDDDASTRTVFAFLELDLTSFASVQACAAQFLAQERRLDILMLNAGVMRANPLLTSEGYEFHFGLNYLGHALLARLLVAVMQRTTENENKDVRVVIISSDGYAMAPKEGIRYSSLRTSCSEMFYPQRYGQSKLALLGLMRELAHRYPAIKSAAVHPGRILTGLIVPMRKESLLVRMIAPLSHFFCVPVAVGVHNHLWVATSPDVVSGTYYEPVGVAAKTLKAAEDGEMPRALWEWTSNELQGLGFLN
ncbi:NAD(P)-binding protein [Astrocystis sublimbata]|nr:NAD(P)-binding protein [Astrocystis sublimbata]